MNRATAGRNREWVVRFALAREVEADAAEPPADDEPGNKLSKDDLDVLTTGFMTIRDERT